MSLFDAAYDAMTYEEVSYRLPGELAVKALKRRILNLDTLLSFFAACGSNPSNIPELKQHINTLLNSYSALDILAKFEEKYHPTLFGWSDDANRERLKNDAHDKLTIKQLFNMTKDSDVAGLTDILERILKDPELKISQVSSVLRKADLKAFQPLLNRIVRDTRPEVRACVLSIGDPNKCKAISNNLRMVGLKSLAKSTAEVKCMDMLDFTLIAALKASERLTVLKKYLGLFPLYHKHQVFERPPTEEELDLTLFAGCIEQNDLVIELKDLYSKITKEDQPADEDA